MPDQLFIGGVWTASSSGKTLAVLDPSTGETIKRIADATADDARAAMDAAANAQEAWAATAPREGGSASDLLLPALLVLLALLGGGVLATVLALRARARA